MFTTQCERLPTWIFRKSVQTVLAFKYATVNYSCHLRFPSFPRRQCGDCPRSRSSATL